MLTFKYVYTAVCGISLWFHENFDLVNILLRCLKNSPPVKRKYSMEYGKQTIEKAVPHKGFKKEMFFFNFALACRNGGVRTSAYHVTPQGENICSDSNCPLIQYLEGTMQT